MESHFKMVSKNAYYHHPNIASIRNTLCVDSAKALVDAFISSHLDYCNSLLYGLPKKSLDRLQGVQNMAARLITGTVNAPIVFELFEDTSVSLPIK